MERLQSIGFTWGGVSLLSEESWDRKFAALEAWKARHGGEDPPRKATFLGLNLGNWCDVQRTARKKNKLLASRVERLQSIGFTWNPGRGAKRKRCHHDDEDERDNSRDSCREEFAWCEANIDGFIVKAFGAV